ncbi:tyrosine-type recombinase/integrase [Bosea sp. PAMC 26642]|uniref:tyrosine-type recombinase/integrase n=1 Tax=Bosea sp. (strain PAMC 26642) TaxID=1792307 RepID=UPI002FF712D1
MTSIAIKNLREPGIYGDGAGLYLQIGPTGAKSWLFRFMRRGKARAMGLGPLHTIGLAEARQAALACRKELLDGRDPIEERKARFSPTTSSQPTFNACTQLFLAAHEHGWKNPKHRAQWTSTLDRYAGPVFGDKPVDLIDVELVMRVLEPIWPTKTETASRVRGRIEAVLNWATVRGYRSGDNPARWRGHLDALLPVRTKVRKVRHHPALPYADLPAFVRQLLASDATAARALLFTILTAARTGEVVGATWIEIDNEKSTWTIPPDRMKAAREHRIPLGPEALAILGPGNKARFPLFHSGKSDSPMSNFAMLALLKRWKRADITPHGFRSTFRDWVAEQTSFPQELAEMALAHTILNKVEAAYRRGDMFERRRELMIAWENFCFSEREGI